LKYTDNENVIEEMYQLISYFSMQQR